MAENQLSSTINAAFPAPPPYYKSFTPTNIALLESHLKDSQQGSSQESSHQQQALQAPTTRAPLPELTHLVPPLPPKDGIYRLFGTQHDVRAYLPFPFHPISQYQLTHYRTSRSSLYRLPFNRPHIQPLHVLFLSRDLFFLPSCP